MRRWLSVWLCLIVLACQAELEPPEDPRTELSELRSGFTFLNRETQSLQQDEFANPGYLWVDQGEALFETPPPTGPSCVTCHDTKLVGVATQFPKFHATEGKLFNLESQINYCRTERQSLPALPYESTDLLSLTAFVATQSNGSPVTPLSRPEHDAAYQTGKRYFYTRRGQFNLSCAQCHNQNWGSRLRGDTLSQGHGNGFPAYRLEWESLGSLQRRLRDCDRGVRAEPLDYGDETYLALEYYLARRAAGLEIESPAIRR